MPTQKFTKIELAEWRAYERVRASGKYNMLAPRARAASGLDRDRYLFVIENYEKLQEAAKGADSPSIN